MSRARIALALAALGIALAAAPVRAQDGRATYLIRCSACHDAGVAGAPKRGSTADWAPRLKAGREALYRSAAQGTPKGMPARGGDPDLADKYLRAAVDYLLEPVVASASKAAEKPAPVATRTAAPKPATLAARAAEASPPAPPIAPPAAVQNVAAPAAAPSAAPLPLPGNGAAESNAFNRLLRAPGRRNLPPMEDGVHDPAADGTPQLQPPLGAFETMTRANAGNRVDWVKSLEHRKIAPRWDREKPEATATVMDLNIVREVKGSMPDVVYPHKQHTEWLDCANCHPAIFLPQKGANAMSMASILLGQGCGACHGRVAFPVSECRLCHSRKKDPAQSASHSAAAGGKP